MAKITKSYLLHRAAEKAIRLDFFLGKVLLEYMTIQGLDKAGLAKKLGCNLDQFSRLALCRQPQEDSDNFRYEIESIAKFIGIEPVKLGQLIREAASLRVLKNSERKDLSILNAGLLLAARDRLTNIGTNVKSIRKNKKNERSKRQ